MKEQLDYLEDLTDQMVYSRRNRFRVLDNGEIEYKTPELKSPLMFTPFHRDAESIEVAYDGEVKQVPITITYKDLEADNVRLLHTLDQVVRDIRKSA